MMVIFIRLPLPQETHATSSLPRRKLVIFAFPPPYKLNSHKFTLTKASITASLPSSLFEMIGLFIFCNDVRVLRSELRNLMLKSAVPRPLQDFPQQWCFPISMASWVYDSDLSEDVKDKNTIVIEDDVWIGVGSVILSGLRVGRSAVIAAGSTVTRDVSENTIVAGNPAKAVGQRFSASDFVIQSEALSRRYRK